MFLTINVLKIAVDELLEDRGVRGRVVHGLTKHGEPYVAAIIDQQQPHVGPLTDAAIQRVRLRAELERRLVAEWRPEDRWVTRMTVLDRWVATCGECLRGHKFEGTRENAIEALRELWWELCDNGHTYCLDCSRMRREVPFPTNDRGVRRRRR